MAEVKSFRGEGGNVWRLELPLSEALAEQVEKGLLVPVEDEKPKRSRRSRPEPESAGDGAPAEAAAE